MALGVVLHRLSVRVSDLRATPASIQPHHPRSVMAKFRALSWTPAPAEHDYPAAASYLELIATAGEIDEVVALLSEPGKKII